jgi:hypothetical protein
LSGCEVTHVGNAYHCTAGFICLGGEVFRVLEHDTTITAGQTAAFAVDVSYDPSGLETFEDLSVNNTYEVRTAKLVSTAYSYPASYMHYNAPNLKDVIYNQIKSYGDAGWHVVGSNDEPAFEADWENGSNPVNSNAAVCAFQKDAFGCVYIKGDVVNTDGHGIIFTLPDVPDGYRPAENITRYLHGVAGAADTVLLTITTDGEVTVNTLHTTYLNLDIQFKI